jgi:dTDP-glucose 4,6-dehydratase
MRALVTGGAGFIGSALVDALVADGVPTLTLDALTYAGDRANLSGVDGSPDHQLVECDVRNTEQVGAVLSAFRPTTVFHLAAETHVDRSIDDPAACVSANVEGTYSLLAALSTYWNNCDDRQRDAFRYVQVSTDEVFGNAMPGEAFVETSRYRPNSPYGASKASANYLVRTWSMAFGLPVIVVHPTNTFGPRQFPEKLIPLMTLNAVEGRELPVYAGGDQVRDWLHVGDLVRGLRAAAERGVPGQSYLLDARQTRTNLGIVHAICGILDDLHPDGAPHARLVTHVADRPAHDRRYASDPAKAEAQLGWRAVSDFDTALRETVAWYLANRDWCTATAERYGRERLGLGRAAQ